MELEPFVDATKAAEFVNLRPRRLLQLARDGSIPAYPIGDGPNVVCGAFVCQKSRTHSLNVR
jgi:hypothetical protein